MANNHTTLTSLFVDIANAIRAKKNSTESIVADTFPVEIANLRTGFDYNNHNATSIADYEFYNCLDVNHVNCYSLTSIGTSAFEGCENLKTVILYDSVTSVGANAFKGCGNVIIYCEAESKPDAWDENWNPDDCEVVWGFEPVETWDASATENDNVIAKLYNDVHNEGMYSLVISGHGDMINYASQTSMLWYSYRSNIVNVIICNGITSIGQYAFYNCKTLTSVNIPDSVTSIGGWAFSNCDMTSVTIGNSVTNIGSYAFYWCDMTSVTIPESVTSIGHGAFGYCKTLTHVTIGNSVTRIGDSAFEGCSSLTSITIPDSVTSIGKAAFENCTSLTSVNIPDSVTRIGSYAFMYCSHLTSLIYTGTVAQWNAINFGSSWNTGTGDFTVHCTDGDITKEETLAYVTVAEEVPDDGEYTY